MLTKMWGAISSKDMEKLKQLLEDNPSAVDERASDGRGPLWCVSRLRAPAAAAAPDGTQQTARSARASPLAGGVLTQFPPCRAPRVISPAAMRHHLEQAAMQWELA